MSHRPRCEWPRCTRAAPLGLRFCRDHQTSDVSVSAGRVLDPERPVPPHRRDGVTVLEELFVGIDREVVLRIAVLQGVSGAVRIELTPVIPRGTPEDDSWQRVGAGLTLRPMVVGPVARALAKIDGRWGGRA